LLAEAAVALSCGRFCRFTRPRGERLACDGSGLSHYSPKRVGKGPSEFEGESAPVLLRPESVPERCKAAIEILLQILYILQAD
jgi:hypothetical protein